MVVKSSSTPTASTEPLTELFAAEGPLAAAIPGFAVRREQIAMAQLVMRAIAQREHWAIEAGTGIGKTFAYLVPAVLAGRRVVVSTGTRTLQDQLFHRDLPIITRALGRPVRVALLKGRANYLCRYRLETTERELALNPRWHEQLRAFERIRRWAEVTCSGDIGEVTGLNESDPLWSAVTSTRENCLGVDCPQFQRCHVIAARREAQAADVVVVNHYLLMADLLLKERGFGDLLPGADAVVIDEAHQLPEVAEQFLGYTVSSRQLQHFCRDLQLELKTQSKVSERLSSLLVQIERATADTVDTLQTERCAFEAWPQAFRNAVSDIANLLARLATELEALAATQPALAACKARAEELQQRLIEFSPVEGAEAGVDDSIGVRWAEASRHGFAVHFAPIDIAQPLSALIEVQDAAWIFTSATLAVGGDFTHYLRRIGVRAHTALFGSPFDYGEQAMLYLPRELADPSSPEHTRQVIDATLPVLEASGGRAFLLFTSHRALRNGAEYLRQCWRDGAPYPLFVQGEQPRDVLLTRFRDAGNGVLLGTGSFWEGVDVKGPALAVVVIDKLPFAVPDDPVLKARLKAIERRGGSPFVEEQVPHAAIALKQGVGRLIRDTADFGVVMLGDRRVLTRGYGRLILDSLPPLKRTERLDEVCAFLRQRLAQVRNVLPAPQGMP